MDAAASIFSEEGYHYASINNICKKADISNGALYKYFKNKESLYFSLLDYITNLVENDLYKKYIVNEKTLYEDLYKFLKALDKFTEENPDYIAIYSDLGSSSMNHFASVIAEKFRRATSRYTIKMIDESKKRGEIDSNIKSTVAAYMMDSYITLFSYSLVSEYHRRRFESFFTEGDKELSKDEKIEFIIESLKQAFKK